MAIRERQIVYVGERGDTSWHRLVGPDTNVVDVDGRTIIPGIIDSHTHPELVALSSWHISLPRTVSGDGVPKHTIGAGGYFGEIGLIDGGVRSATVTAATELTTLALVSWDFQPMLDNPAFAKGLLLGLCRLVRDYRESAAGS